MMMRLFWRECREQAWFAVAAFLSPALMVFLTSVSSNSSIRGENFIAAVLSLPIFAVWGVLIVVRERDAGSTEMSFVPVSRRLCWLVKAVPGIVTALLTGCAVYLVTWAQTVFWPSAPGESQTRFHLVSVVSVVILTLMMMVVFTGAYLTAFGLGRSAGSRWALTVRRWFICASVVVTATVVGGTILLFGRRWDAQTVFGPADIGIRPAAMSPEVSRSNPSLSEDARMEVTKRMAQEAGAPDIAARALCYLAGARTLRLVISNTLETDLISQPKGIPNYTRITEAIRSAKARMTSEQVKQVEEATGIPSALWGDFAYLDSKIVFHQVPTGFLRKDQLNDALAALYRSTEVVFSSQEIHLSVRDSIPRKAEILVNAMTVTHKYVYEARRRAAANQQHLDLREPASVRHLHPAVATDTLVVRYWAGPPPGTLSHPEVPAREGATKRNWFLFWAAVLLSLFGSSLTVFATSLLDRPDTGERRVVSNERERARKADESAF